MIIIGRNRFNLSKNKGQNVILPAAAKKTGSEETSEPVFNSFGVLFGEIQLSRVVILIMAFLAGSKSGLRFTASL